MPTNQWNVYIQDGVYHWELHVNPQTPWAVPPYADSAWESCPSPLRKGSLDHARRKAHVAAGARGALLEAVEATQLGREGGGRGEEGAAGD